MDKYSELENEPLTTEPAGARKVGPIVVALAVIGGLVLLPIVSTVLAVALKVSLGLLAAAIGLAAGLVSLVIGLALGACGLAIGLIGALVGFLVTPPGLVLVALAVYFKARDQGRPGSRSST